MTKENGILSFIATALGIDKPVKSPIPISDDPKVITAEQLRIFREKTRGARLYTLAGESSFSYLRKTKKSDTDPTPDDAA